MQNHHFDHSSDPLTLVLLVNLGSPDAPTPAAIRRYLREFLSDTRVIEIPRLLWWWILHLIILPLRPRRLASNYATIFTPQGAPLIQGTADIAQLLSTRLAGRVEVDYAMRYGNPSITKRLDYWREKRLERIIVLPLYPQYAASTVGTVFDQVARSLMGWRWVPDTRFIHAYYDDSNYLQALAASIAAKRKPDHMLLISFHGLPLATLEKGDPYYCHCHKTARQLAAHLGLQDNEWKMTFQSRFGAQPWLTPYTDQVLESLPQEGTKQVQIVCPGFAVDCLETLEEIMVENRTRFIDAGGESYQYIACLNSSDAQISMLAQLVEEQLECYSAADNRKSERQPQQHLYLKAADNFGLEKQKP